MQKNLNFYFKPLEASDVSMLYTWFHEPHVSYWWPMPKKNDEFFEMFRKRIHSKDTFPYLVLFHNEPIGYIQYYHIEQAKNRWLPQLPKNTAGIDQFIGKKELLSKGLGTAFIKEFLEFLAQEKQITSIIVDPSPINLAAIRCYEKVGFKKLGEFEAPWGPVLVMHILTV